MKGVWTDMRRAGIELIEVRESPALAGLLKPPDGP